MKWLKPSPQSCWTSIKANISYLETLADLLLFQFRVLTVLASSWKEYIKGNISSFYARVPQASAVGQMSIDISPHRSDVSSNVPAHVCCGMSGYHVISCRGSRHGLWCRHLCYFWLSRHPWPFAHFWAVFVKLGICAETSMPGICTSWGWGQQNSAEGHASWSSPRAGNFLPAVLLCRRWLEDPGTQRLRALRPIAVWVACQRGRAVQSFQQCNARPTVPTTRQTMYLLQAWHGQWASWIRLTFWCLHASIFNTLKTSWQ